jgi:energy-coupling factor transporter ATP-binding protein EcfA2
MMETIPLLAAHGLYKTYRRHAVKVEVLRGLDLEVYPGEFLSVVGASGSGKSTMLHLLGTLDEPQSFRQSGGIGGFMTLWPLRNDGGQSGGKGCRYSPLPGIRNAGRDIRSAVETCRFWHNRVQAGRLALQALPGNSLGRPGEVVRTIRIIRRIGQGSRFCE